MITNSWQFDIEMTHVIYILNFQSDHKSDVKCNRGDQQLSSTYHVPGIFIELILEGRYYFCLCTFPVSTAEAATYQVPYKCLLSELRLEDMLKKVKKVI